MTFGSLFSGIGGLDLGLERAGMKCRWQVEIDPFCRKVLAKHWPDVRRHDDVKTFPPTDPEDWSVDLIAGGFPCQDLSKAGRVVSPRRRLDGQRSGLWVEFARIVRILRPAYVLVENSTELLSGGLGRILGELATLGFDAEWHCVPAAAVGAPHIRDRLFVLAYADGEAIRGPGRAPIIGPAQGVRRAKRGWTWLRPHRRPVGARPGVGSDGEHGGWLREPGMDRVADGLPAGVVRSRYRGYGNAVVPQVAQWIGERIMLADAATPLFRDEDAAHA